MRVIIDGFQLIMLLMIAVITMLLAADVHGAAMPRRVIATNNTGNTAAANSVCRWQSETGAVFDLSSLSRSPADGNWKGSDAYLNWEMNVCAPVVNRPECDGQSICSFWADDHKVHQSYGSWDASPLPTWSLLADTNPGLGVAVTFHNGRAQCQGRVEIVRVEFVCNATATQIIPTFYVKEDFAQCETVIRIETAVACPAISSSCHWENDHGHKYDFSSLRSTTQNYRASDTNFNYELNFCGPLVAQPDCPQGGLCTWWKAPLRFSAVMAFWTERSPLPVISQLVKDQPTSGLSITFHNGHGLCGSTRERVIINLICDPTVLANNYTFDVIESWANCEITITVRTAASCPVGNGCRWTSPAGDLYDFNAMKRTSDNYRGDDQYIHFEANVCAPVVGQPKCQPGASFCSFWRDDGSYRTSYGGWHSSPLPTIEPLEDGRLGALFTFHNGASMCGNVRQTVLLRLVCNPKDVEPGQVTVYEDWNQCLIYMTIYSPDACPYSDPCTYTVPSDGTYFDLRGLQRTDSYIGEDRYLRWHMNFCAAISRADKGYCGDDDAFCTFWKDDGSFQARWGSWDRLPAPRYSLINDFKPDLGLVVTFTNGDATCDGTQETIELRLPCDPKAPIHRSISVVDDYANCKVVITHASPLSCPVPDPCKWTSPEGARFDLTPLELKSGISYTGDDQHLKYLVNVCGPIQNQPECGDDSVCSFWKVDGKPAHIYGKFDAVPTPRFSLIEAGNPLKGVQVAIANSANRCQDKPRTVNLRLICDPAAPLPTTFTVEDDFYHCILTINMTNPISCPR